jgi:flagellar basal body L-ring protein FlgH
MQKAKIVVAVRKRPLFEKERAKGYNDIVQVNGNTQVVVSEMKYRFDLMVGKRLT